MVKFVVKASGNRMPADLVQESLHIPGAVIVIPQVISMFPYIAHQQRAHAWKQSILVVVGGQNDKSVAHAISGQNSPAAALHTECSPPEQTHETIIRAEACVYGICQFFLRAQTGYARQVTPVKSMQHVACQIKGQIAAGCGSRSFR